MADDIKPKEPITVKLTQDTINTLNEFRMARAFSGISPFIEYIVESYIKDYPLTEEEKKVYEFLKRQMRNAQAKRPSAPSASSTNKRPSSPSKRSKE